MSSNGTRATELGTKNGDWITKRIKPDEYASENDYYAACSEMEYTRCMNRKMVDAAGSVKQATAYFDAFKAAVHAAWLARPQQKKEGKS